MTVDTPGVALKVISVMFCSFLFSLGYELLCIKFVYNQEEYQEVLEREKNIKVKIAAEKHKLLYGQVSANKKKQ